MRDQFRISVEHDFFYSRESFLPVVEKSTDFSHNETFFGLDCVFYLLIFGCLSGPGNVLESSKWTVLNSAVLKCKKNASSIVTGPNITGSPSH